jgi:hypothetical protein
MPEVYVGITRSLALPGSGGTLISIMQNRTSVTMRSAQTGPICAFQPTIVEEPPAVSIRRILRVVLPPGCCLLQRSVATWAYKPGGRQVDQSRDGERDRATVNIARTGIPAWEQGDPPPMISAHSQVPGFCTA